MEAQGPARSGSGLTILEPEHKGRSVHSAIEPAPERTARRPARSRIRGAASPEPGGASREGSRTGLETTEMRIRYPKIGNGFGPEVTRVSGSPVICPQQYHHYL